MTQVSTKLSPEAQNCPADLSVPGLWGNPEVESWGQHSLGRQPWAKHFISLTLVSPLVK